MSVRRQECACGWTTTNADGVCGPCKEPRGRVQLTTGVEAERAAREAGATTERARIVAIAREMADRYGQAASVFAEHPTMGGEARQARDALLELVGRVER